MISTEPGPHQVEAKRRRFKRWSNATEEDSHRLWNLLWSSLVWFSTPSLGGARSYRTRPMSQNTHLTLEGNKEKKITSSVSPRWHISISVDGASSPSPPLPSLPPSLRLLCSPQEVEHARAGHRSRPWWPAIAALRIAEVIFSHVTQHWEGSEWVTCSHFSEVLMLLQNHKAHVGRLPGFND